MAHEKFYATCENKCRVDITDKVVKARCQVMFSSIIGGMYEGYEINLSNLGITNHVRTAAIITPNSHYVMSGENMLEITHSINDDGIFTMTVKNKTSMLLQNVSFSVVFI